MTDVELDARVTVLEENGGDGSPQNGKHGLLALITGPILLQLSCPKAALSKCGELSKT